MSITKIDKKPKKLLEIGYTNSNNEEVYYADSAAREKINKINNSLKELNQNILDLNSKELTLISKVENLETRVNELTSTTNCVPKELKGLNTLTNEITQEQISMDKKDIFLYVDNNSKPSKVSVIELGKIHNKLTPLVRTVDTDNAFNIIKDDLQDGEYIYKSAEIQEK